MSKNFEETYKAEVQRNIPDLWDRIESSLPEKNVTEVKAPAKKKKNPYAWMKWATLAAAGVLVVLIMPGVIGLGILQMVIRGSADYAPSAEMLVTESAKENAMEMGESDYFAPEADSEIKDGTMIQNNASGSLPMEDIAGESISMESAVEEETATVTDESPAYYELIAGAMHVKVVSVTTEDAGYGVTLQFSPVSQVLADNFFEYSPYYEDSQMYVIVYDGRGDVPVAGETYTANFYETTHPGTSIVVPYAAELKKE